MTPPRIDVPPQTTLAPGIHAGQRPTAPPGGRFTPTRGRSLPFSPDRRGQQASDARGLQRCVQP